MTFLASFVVPIQVWAAGVTLLQPVNGISEIDTSNPNFIFVYINAFYPWIMGVAGGLCVLWGIWGGSGIILSGGDQSKVTENKNRVLAAVAGLLILLFAATILHTINPVAFSFT